MPGRADNVRFRSNSGSPISVVVRSANDPGCVKTRLGEGCAELDEIEMEVLFASWASEFSRSLDPERTLRRGA
jgi:hypothetical protein